MITGIAIVVVLVMMIGVVAMCLSDTNTQSKG